MTLRTLRLAFIAVFAVSITNIALADPYSEQDLWWSLKCSYGVDPLAHKDQTKPFEKGKSLVFPPIIMELKAEKLGEGIAPLLKEYWGHKAFFFVFPFRLGKQWMALRVTKDDSFLIPEILDSSEKPLEALANKMWSNIQRTLPEWPKSEALTVLNNLVQPDSDSSGPILIFNLLNQGQREPRRLTVAEVDTIREEHNALLGERDKAPGNTGFKKIFSVFKPKQ
jgi:hypothetical protein